MEIVAGHQGRREHQGVADGPARRRLDTIPARPREILDDDVRWVLTKGKLPASRGVEVCDRALAGHPRSSTMMYATSTTPATGWATCAPGPGPGHHRRLHRVRGAAFIHRNAPIYLAGVARPGPSRRDKPAVHAMARGPAWAIPNIQCSWVKLGEEGTAEILNGGAKRRRRHV